MIKHVNAVEVRVVVAAVLAAAADAVLVAHHLPKLGAHLDTALARLKNLARRSSLEVGARERKGRGGAGSLENFSVALWHGKEYTRVARARVSRTGVWSGLPLKLLELWAPCKARWVWTGAVAKYLFWPRARCSSPGRKRREAVAIGEEQLGRCASGNSKYYRLHRHSGKLALAAMYLRRVCVL